MPHPAASLGVSSWDHFQNSLVTSLAAAVMPADHEPTIGQAGDRRIALLIQSGRIDEEIAADAEANGFRMNDFIMGVVKSDAFRMARVPAAADNDTK